ncbi:NAD(P)-dependent oxidoreductase [Nibricoccus sp. IMCC34717]|uniref:NAD(P)-dependent oxidoreductase n=1 Tax=Nibricoccus sp. IMCC34717 TaxID=3034021 RepID=UPI00384FC30D
MNKVAVLGLGIIGSIWASHYRAAGVLVGAWNRTAKPEFSGWTPDLAALAGKASVLHLVVADPPAVESVLQQILPALGPGKTVIQSSTIDPQSSEAFRARVEATGAAYLEAPFTGSKPAAEAHKTVFYLGGDAELVERVTPLLAHLSEVRFHIGTNRQACTLKLAMNLNIAAQMQALSEALALARDAGVTDAMFFAALQKNASHSGVAALKEPKLRSGDYSPQFSVKHMLKDMRLASRSAGCRELPMLDVVRERLHLAAEKGHAEDDYAVLAKLV